MLRLPIFLTIISSYALASKLGVVYEWKYIDYLWESAEQKNNAIAGKSYDHKQIFTIDVQEVPDGRVFVTTPAFNPNAVPATLSTVSDKIGPGGPLLKPYPNWQWHNSRNCKGMISVWRVALDECDRLWILDSGKIGDEQVCPAQLLIFDIRSNELKKRITIPNDISHDPKDKNLGLLITPVIETEGFNCKRTRVYLADTEGGGLVILDGTYTWRLDDDVFNPDPSASDFSIAGENFTLPDGLFGLALTPKTGSYSRRLFFRPLASLQQYSSSVDDLHRSRTSNNRFRYTSSEYRLPSQVAAQAFSKDGILFFGLTTEIAIACWNRHTPLDEKHVVIVAQDSETLQFASGVKVTRQSHYPFKEQLWVTTNRFQKIMTGSQNFDETNFRILSATVDELVRNSRCESWRRGDTWSSL